MRSRERSLGFDDSADSKGGARWIGWLAAATALSALYALGVRPTLLRWGATLEESASPLPGDGLIPRPVGQTTRAVTIAAPPDKVWPWLVQIGYQRAGWYSYDLLEKAVGAGEFAEGHSAERILPQFQNLKMGDLVPAGPDMGWFTVADLDPPRFLALRATMNPLTGKAIPPDEPRSAPWFDGSWVFVLEETSPGTTRLMARFRASYAPRWQIAPLAVGLIEPAHFLMEQKMLRGIKERAEAARQGER